MNYFQFLNKLKRTRITPDVFYIHGEDLYLKDLCIKLIINKFNMDVMGLDKVKLRDLQTALMQKPFGNRCLYVVDVAKIKESKEKLYAIFAKKLSNSVALMSVERNFPKRDSGIEVLEKVCWKVNCRRLKDDSLKMFIETELKARGVLIERRALDLFTRKVGTSLYKVVSEINKASYYSKHLIAQDIENLVNDYTSMSIIDYVNTIVSIKNSKFTIEQYHKMLETGSLPIHFINVLEKFFLNVIKITALKKEVANKKDKTRFMDFKDVLGVSEYMKERLMSYSRAFGDIIQVKVFLERLYEMDYAHFRGKDIKYQLEDFFVDLTKAL